MTKSQIEAASKEYSHAPLDTAEKLKAIQAAGIGKYELLRELIQQGFISGAQWYERSLEGVVPEITKERLLEVVEEWQQGWMSVTGTNDEDAKNYWRRAFGVDANMRYGMARMMLEHLQPVQALIASQKAEIERLRKALELVQEMIAVSKRKGHLDEDLALTYIREALGAKDE